MLNKMVLITFFSLILAVTEGFSQDKPANQTIVYDPLFWKGKLKLKYWQQVKINSINADFYSSIMESSRTANETPGKEKVNKLLTQRSEKIWSTFSPRQKSIWKKLESEFSASI